MNKLFGLTLLVCVAAGMIGALSYLPLRFSQAIIMSCGLILFISWYYLKNVWLKLFMTWMIVRSLMFMTPPTLYTILFTTIIVFFYQTLKDKLSYDRVEIVFNVISILALIESLFVILQALGIWFIYTPTYFDTSKWLVFNDNSIFSLSICLDKSTLIQTSISGTMGNINIASALFGMSIVTFFRKGWIWGLLAIVPALVMTHSLGGIIPAVVVSIIYVFIKFRALRWYLIGFILIGFAWFLIKNETVNSILDKSARAKTWPIYIKELIPMKWLHGWGTGQAPYLNKIILNTTESQGWYHPHNEYINLWLEYGFIGFSIVLGYFISLFYKCKSVLSDRLAFLTFLGIIAGLINCIVSFSLHVSVGIVFLLYLVIFDYQKSKMEESDEQE